VFDATGREIGPIVDGPMSRLPSIFHGASGVVFSVELRFGALVPRRAPVLFENADCTGAAYFTIDNLSPDNPPPYLALVQSDSRFFVLERGIPAVITTRSRIRSEPEAVCEALLRTDDRLLPARPFSLGDLGFAFPLPAPLYVAPSLAD